MTRKNIKVPEPLFNALRDDKSDNQSWPHYLESECLHDADGDDVADRLERIEAAVKEATNAAQNAERAAEELKR
ncbi:hypothetical protein HRTV-28_gp20 [Halorubrum tailed virus 28]|uniref:Uncharacterized protein n=1 Tax=Halorubrum tailed virus 28 TaxID=2878009 RepID=A0AAE8Y1Z0_9CAUD|nr:hypothetical protein M1M39_gp21 [Halorubrum tailed virus 28]UBF23458.1 hypothetical protein HRTV-28_gp20 [Halorubrum tailed virus 28]